MSNNFSNVGPEKEVVCRSCREAVWQSVSAGERCFCQVLGGWTYGMGEQPVTACTAQRSGS